MKQTEADTASGTAALTREWRRPVCMVGSRWVEQPHMLLVNDGRCRIFASHADMEIVLDFGEELAGWFSLRIDTVSHCRVSIAYGEDLPELDADQSSELPYYKHPRDRFDLTEGSHVLQSRGRRAFRFIRICCASGAGDTWIDSVGVWSVHWPVVLRGSFASSDPLLDRSYTVAANTVKWCMQRFYEDGVKRDGLLWIGDARVECLGGYLAFGDYELARRSLHMMAATQLPDGSLPACSANGGGHQHPDNIDYMPQVVTGVSEWILDNYCADFISMLLEYALYSGDLQTVIDLWPVAARVMDYLTAIYYPVGCPETGKFITDENVAVRDTWWTSPGTMVMQFHWALRDMAHVSLLVGEREHHAKTIRLADDVRQQILALYRTGPHTLFTDVPRAACPVIPSDLSGSSADPIPMQQAGLPPVSWHVNAFAVLGSLLEDRHEQKALIKRISQVSDASYPIAGFMKYWILRGIMEAGLMDKALQDLRSYWGFMLDHGATTFWEKLDIRRPERVLENPVVSRCHGWTCGPCILLPEHVLGVKPTEPGYRRILAKPNLGDLEWAEGTLPTPQGNIFVHWENDGILRGYMHIPEGVLGNAVLPGPDGLPRHFSLKPGDNWLDPAKVQ